MSVVQLTGLVIAITGLVTSVAAFVHAIRGMRAIRQHTNQGDK